MLRAPESGAFVVELLGRYSNWIYWAERTRSLAKNSSNRANRDHISRGTARRLNRAEVAALADGYRAGATVYELAVQFKIHRTTVSDHLRRQGVQMRRQSLDTQQLDVAAWLYEQGWSVAKIGRRWHVDGTTVWRALRARGVRMRDAHGR
jgi:hypothetical protein